VPTQRHAGLLHRGSAAVTKNGVLLADARGSPEATRGLVEAIRKVTSQPIKYVIIFATSTPEPASIYLLLTGPIAGAACWRFRNRAGVVA
jgi:hypothetical protein